MLYGIRRAVSDVNGEHRVLVGVVPELQLTISIIGNRSGLAGPLRINRESSQVQTKREDGRSFLRRIVVPLGPEPMGVEWLVIPEEVTINREHGLRISVQRIDYPGHRKATELDLPSLDLLFHSFPNQVM